VVASIHRTQIVLTLAESGNKELAARIEHQAKMGDLLRETLVAADWQILNKTPLPVVCFTYPQLAAPQLSAMLDQIYDQGTVWLSETRLRGQIPALRACITSFRTQKEDVAILVDILEKTLNRLNPKGNHAHLTFSST